MLSSTQKAIPFVNTATEQIHAAAQYLSMAGKFFLENKPDDSHTNLGWDATRSCFIGRNLGGPQQVSLALFPESFSLVLLNAQLEPISELALDGLRLQEGEDWVKRTLSSVGLENPDYRLDLHYQLPEYAIFKTGRFEKKLDESHLAFSTIRSLGDQVLKQYQPNFEHASELRTWPHHFDHGIYCPLAFNTAGEPIKSISLGLAIHDATIPEPYFYITHWQEDPAAQAAFPSLPGKAYWNTTDFTGAILKISDLLALESELERKEQIHHYFLEGIRQSLGFMKLPPIPFSQGAE
ncbi:MAG: hypothetical protein KDC34_09520 [Saprospiraceae bacterium]|nr:hypothetical protein [Saprospiraceae bacterium]